MAKTFVHAHQKFNHIDRKLERNRRHDRMQSLIKIDKREMKHDYSVR